MKLGDLVRQEREKRGWSQRDLGRRADVSPPVVSRLESGERLGRIDTIMRITAALGLDPERVQRLLAGDEVEAAEEAPSVDDLLAQLQAARRRERESETRYEVLPQRVVMVPIVESFAAAGEGAVAQTEFWPYIPTPEETGHEFAGIRVRGDCLAPRILDGELALVDKSASPKTGDVVAALVDGESLLRIYQGDQLVSLNGHPPIRVDDRVRIEGVVVYVGRRP